MASTLYRISEQISRILNGGEIPVAANPSIPQIKISVGQVINQLLKTDVLQMNVNRDMDERVPNGTVLGLYEDIEVVPYNGKSKATLPIKPIKLPRNMGVWAIYPKWEANGNYELDKEFIPLQMGQGGLLKSQSLISDLLGQVGYETFGMEVVFTKDLTAMYESPKVAMRLAIMDVSLLDDYDILPILPEMEATVIQAVVAMFRPNVIQDKLVDSGVNQQLNVPITQQRMS